MASSEVGIACSGPSSPDNVSFTSYVLLSAPSPCERRHRLRVVWADLTPCELSAALLSVETRLPVAVVNPASRSFRLRPTWVWVSPCVASLAVCLAHYRFGSRFSSGTRRVSQVPVRFFTCVPRSKVDPGRPSRTSPRTIGPSVLASGTVNTVAICAKRLDGAVSSFGDYGLSCGLHVSLCTLQLTCSAFDLRSCSCNTR